MKTQKMNPKPGREAVHVLVLGRVSTTHQAISNIEAGYEYAEKAIADICDGQPVVRRLGEQGSGMLVDRETILEAYELIRDGWPDVVLMEDVSKSYRNPRWIFAFVQDCADEDIRVIAPGDGLDTWDENWEVALGAAALRHGLHIPDTRRRIRRTSSKTFAEGGMVVRVRAGYRKLTKEEAASGQFGPRGLRLAKLPEWTPIFQSLRQRVLQGSGGVALADWLNDQEPPIPVPPYAKKEKWCDNMVLNLLRDPLLYGLRQYPKVRHEPRLSDGKHKRIKNADPQRQYYPELAHLTQAEWEEMVTKLDQLGGKEAQPAGTHSARYHVARHKSLTPLQHARCVVCQGVYYMNGADSAKCCHGLKHEEGGCWNHVQISCATVREKLVDLLLRVLDRNPQARKVLLDAVWSEIEQHRRRGQRGMEAVEKELADLDRQAQRLAEAIAAGGKLDSLVQKLKAVEAERKAAIKRQNTASGQTAPSSLPASKETLQIAPRPALIELANTSYEFADLLRKVIPSFIIQPVQSLDHGLVRPRAVLTLDLGALLPAQTDPNLRPRPELVTIDLFDPPVHIERIPAILRLQAAKQQRHEKATLDILANELGIGRMTVRRALAYHRLMQDQGLTEPYRVLTAPPAKASRWMPRRRHGSDETAA